MTNPNTAPTPPSSTALMLACFLHPLFPLSPFDSEKSRVLYFPVLYSNQRARPHEGANSFGLGGATARIFPKGSIVSTTCTISHESSGYGELVNEDRGVKAVGKRRAAWWSVCCGGEIAICCDFSWDGMGGRLGGRDCLKGMWR